MNRDSIKQRFNIIGNTPKLNTAIDIAMQVAPTEVTVLVYGENGTGKDNFSRIIHLLSKRKHSPLISINCGAIPDGTIDSELFGHEKGSFTSAYESRKGYFEEANGGVVFLDEIAELPMATQARLLRVLENGEYLRVGSSKIQKTDVRIVAATNKNLVEAIRLGKFREDLFFRLNTITIYVPPLRDRGDDIELLFRYFAGYFAERYGRPPLQLLPEAIDFLYQYHWPGNVRELRNFTEKLTVLIQSNKVSGSDMETHLPYKDTQLPVLINKTERSSQDSTKTESSYDYFNSPDFIMKTLFELKNDVAVIKKAVFTLLQTQFEDTGQEIFHNKFTLPASSSSSAANVMPIEQPMNDLTSATLSLELNEKELISKALEKHHQNRKKAATELGISERTLYRKIKILGLDHEES